MSPRIADVCRPGCSLLGVVPSQSAKYPDVADTVPACHDSREFNAMTIQRDGNGMKVPRANTSN